MKHRHIRDYHSHMLVTYFKWKPVCYKAPEHPSWEVEHSSEGASDSQEHVIVDECLPIVLRNNERLL